MHNYVIVTDRGGHLHNALMLLSQLSQDPVAILTTEGPDVDALSKDMNKRSIRVICLPVLFTWVGKWRFLNPIKLVWLILKSLYWAWHMKPHAVISTGASDVIPFCYGARMFGSRIFHVECMNQVESPSLTGRVLYPICESILVQWPELLKKYGPRAQYKGWVL